MSCASCGFEYHEGLKFCNECGSAFKRRCAQCGFDNAPQAKFCGECGMALQQGHPSVSPFSGHVAGPGVPPSPQVAVPTTPEAERRQLTVMFCDVVGSTTLSEQLDSEELRQVIRAYQDACVATICRFAGHVAKYVGDGLIGYFGCPMAFVFDACR